MQIFVRDPAGKTTSYTASSSADLHAQVLSSLSSQDASAARLSYRSRALNNDDLQSIPPYATLDLNFRLPGGGPKKRCAHVYVKPTSGAGSASSSNAASGSATRAPAPAPAAAATPVPSASASAQAKDGEVKTEGEKKTESNEVDAQSKEAEVSTSTSVEAASTGPEATTSTASTAAPAVQAHEPILERCGNAALRMVGECAKCSKNFCGQHRLPEDHACPALQTFRKAAFDENMKRLSKEATMTNKISAF